MVKGIKYFLGWLHMHQILYWLYLILIGLLLLICLITLLEIVLSVLIHMEETKDSFIDSLHYAVMEEINNIIKSIKNLFYN